ALEDKQSLHLVGDGTKYSGLYEVSIVEIRLRSRPTLLLASALGLLHEQRDATTGKSALVYTHMDEFGVASQIVSHGYNLPQAGARGIAGWQHRGAIERSASAARGRGAPGRRGRPGVALLASLRAAPRIEGRIGPGCSARRATRHSGHRGTIGSRSHHQAQ